MIWIAVLLCIYGSYLLTSNQSVDVRFSDGLLFLSGLFFAFQIILIDVFMKKFKSAFCFASIQYIIVVILSLAVALFYESPSFTNLRLEWVEIAYCGVLLTFEGKHLRQSVRDHLLKVKKNSKLIHSTD